MRRRQWRGLRRSSEGSALLEFAIALPLLVVFLVGIYDFSGAFNQRQKIEHAAQMGAIVAGAQPTSDIYAGNGNPDSLQPVVTVIFNSLKADGLITGGCTLPVTPTPNSGLSWTYTITGCPGNLTVTIDRGKVDPGVTAAVGTEVTVIYPYNWRFNSVIQLLIPGASYSATTNLTETATVHNQT